MAGKGLFISEEEFMALPNQQKWTTLYKNQNDRFDNLERMVRGYRINQLVQYWWLSAITGIGIWIISKYGAIIIPSLIFLSSSI